MTKLKFHDARITLMEAVALLATNQEPWADRVRCSYYDYAIAGFADHGQSAHMMILKNVSLFSNDKETYSIDEIPVHKIEIRPDKQCPEGTVRLYPQVLGFVDW